MKFIVATILTMLLSFCACLFLPWWSIAIAAFAVSVLIPQAPAASFLTGFVGLFLLWGLLSFWISTKNDDILAHRVSLLLLKSDSPMLLILLSAVIGALVGGFAALTAAYLRPAGAAQIDK